MRHAGILLIAVVVCFLASSSVFSAPETIWGVAIMEMKSPATPKLRKKMHAKATDSLKTSVRNWILDELGIVPDLRDSVQAHVFRELKATCAREAEKKSYIEGHRWTVEFAVSSDVVRSIINAANAKCDSLARLNWRIATEAQAANNNATRLTALARSLYYARRRFGEPLAAPDDAEALLAVKARDSLQALLDRLSIASGKAIITGKPPDLTEEPVKATARVDTVPVGGLTLSGYLPDGRKIATARTNSAGEMVFSEMKTPFVAQGTFLHIRPDFNAAVEPDLDIDAATLGVKLSDRNDQTLMFNITRPVFLLEHSFATVSDLEMPKVFADDAVSRRFIIDSLQLQPKTPAQQADLSIRINGQISSYAHDDREETNLKVEAQVTIEELKPNGTKIEKMVVLCDRDYDSFQEIPLGEFYWESSTALKHLLRDMLNEL